MNKPTRKLDFDYNVENINNTPLSEFWSWALSETRDNTARGMYAEYLVAKALGLENKPRKEWTSYDLEYDGKGIEVKASAYLQNWVQKDKNGNERKSKIKFNIPKTSYNNEQTGRYESEKKRHADCYVFCLYKQENRDEFDQDDVLDVT